jgi:predicted 3-demethylubiquinone-9 3-methyltransferase (glyoxalase superfamily)
MPLDKLVTCLWFDHGEARRFADFYCALLPDSHIDRATAAPADNPGNKAGEEMMVEFTLLGRPFLGLNGGPAFKPTMAHSLVILTDSQEETDRYWEAITGNGGAASECGWCSDRWGYSWQVTPRVLMEGTTHSDPDVARRVFEAMMTMGKIDHARIEAALKGENADA